MVHQRKQAGVRNLALCKLVDVWKWPVGQAVKTAASHAVNVGSIPARVTNFLVTMTSE